LQLIASSMQGVLSPNVEQMLSHVDSMTGNYCYFKICAHFFYLPIADVLHK